MAELGNKTPFLKRRRNVFTIMAFLLMFLFPSLMESQPFSLSSYLLDIDNLFVLANMVSQILGSVVATKFGGHQVKNGVQI